jgi:putative addiction module killer protein
MGYIHAMTYGLQSTPTFDKWLAKLKDVSIRNRLLARLDRIETGNFGDFKQIDNSLFELRFFFGGGLRIYYTIRDGKVVLLLAGGDKSSQTKDITKTKALLLEMEV